MAISGATVGSEVERGRWAGLTVTSVDTEGGNISGVNITGATLTDRWASYYGDVSGDIRLTDSAGTNNVYAWSWSPSSGGEVCLSQDGSFPWASAEAALRADIDTAFGFGAGSDQAADTYTDASQTIDLAGLSTITTTGTALQGSSSFVNRAVGDGTEAAEGDFAFCSEIEAGTNYNSESANYEVMVPTSDSAGATETYYFFAELN
ncbi:MAG: hypothetical protein V1861_06995 [Candidatus Micrarchaeota archaeon]